jgi:hypothetical protein
MRRRLSTFSIAIALVAVASDAGHGQGKPGGTAADASSYKRVEWPQPATNAAGFPAPWNLIQVSGIAVSSRGTVLVLHRGAHPVLEFDTAGKFLRSWGDGLFSEGKVAGIPEANWSPAAHAIRRCMGRRGARHAARMPFASIRRAISGWSTPQATSSTRPIRMGKS